MKTLCLNIDKAAAIQLQQLNFYRQQRHKNYPSKFDSVCHTRNRVKFRRICMESSEHHWANISETICPEMLVFGKQASQMLFFQNILTNPIISQTSSNQILSNSNLNIIHVSQQAKCLNCFKRDSAHIPFFTSFIPSIFRNV